jgi:hypothetical protein
MRMEIGLGYGIVRRVDGDENTDRVRVRDC